MIVNPIIQYNLRNHADNSYWSLVKNGAPTNGVDGLGFAGLGSICMDLTTGNLYVNTGSKTSPTWVLILQQQLAGDVSVAPPGLAPRGQYRATYNFAVDGGAIGTITPAAQGTIPKNAIIVGGVINVITALVGSGATIALGTTAGSSATSLKAATAITSYTGLVALVPVWTAASAFKMTAAGLLQLTVATAALTAGKFDIILDYLVGTA